MLPMIGVMVGVIGCTVSLYIMTRCTQIVIDDASGGLTFLAVLTAAVSVVTVGLLVFLSFQLIEAGIESSRSLERIGTLGRVSLGNVLFNI